MRSPARRDQTAAAATAETFVEAAINLKKEMSEDNVPLNDRWLAVPPLFVAKLENHFVTQGGSAAGIFAPAVMPLLSNTTERNA